MPYDKTAPSRGICAKCNDRPILLGKKRCFECVVKTRLYDIAYYSENRFRIRFKRRVNYAKRFNIGLCKYCPNQRRGHSNVCQGCADKGAVRKSNRRLINTPFSMFINR